MQDRLWGTPNLKRELEQSRLLGLMRMLGPHVLVSIGSLVMNCGNLVTSLLAARLLNRSVFSSLMALQALLTVVTTMVALGQPMLASVIAKQTTPEATTATAVRLTRIIFSIALLLSLVWLVVSPLTSQMLGNLTLKGIASGSAFILFATLMTGLFAVAQGHQNFRAIAVGLSVGGLSRPSLFCLAFYASASVWMSVLSYSFACLLVCLVLIQQMSLSVRSHLKPTDLRTLLPSSRPHHGSLFVVFLLSVFSFLDVFIARLFLDDHSAGDFAVAAIVTNISLYFGWVVATVLVPITASRRHLPAQSVQIVRQSVILVVLATSLFSIVLYFIGDRVLMLVGGSSVNISNASLATYSVAFALLSISSLAINFEIANGRAGRHLPDVLVTLFCLSAGIIFFGNTTNGLILTEFVGFSILLTLINLRSDSLLRTCFSRKSSDIASLRS